MENRLKYEDIQDYDRLKQYDKRINDLSSLINETQKKLSYKLSKEERINSEKKLEIQKKQLSTFIAKISQSFNSTHDNESISNSESDS